MKRKINVIVITALCIVFCFLMYIPVAYAGTPHSAHGVVQYPDGSKPPSLTFTAYITIRPGETKTQASGGCSYDSGSGQWWVQVGNFLTGWTAGETLHIDFDDGAGGTASDDIVLTDAGADDGGTTVIPRTTLTMEVSPGGGGTTTPAVGDHYYYDGGSVNVSATHAAEYRFSHWSGGLTGSTNPDNVTMNGNKTVTANFVKIWTLTVNVSPGGAGTVTKNPDQTNYDDQTSVQLTANDNAGWVFSHWSGNLTGSTNPDNITMDANKTVTANYVAARSLTMQVNPGGAGTTDPSVGFHGYVDDTTVPVEAFANAGYRFDQWSDDLTGSTNPDNITMNADKTVTANYVKIWTLTVNSDPAGGGTVTKNPDQGTYDDETSVQLTANANAGYRFDHWSGGLTGSTNPDNVTMNGNKTVTANFVKIWTLTVNVSPGGAGTVTKNPDQTDYDDQTSVQLTANDNAGWMFSHWSGGLTGSTNPDNVTMDANKTVTANYVAARSLTIQVNPGGAGTTDPPVGVKGYADDTTVPVEAFANTGYRFDQWSDDLTGSTNPDNITMNADKTVTANFVKIWTLTVNIDPAGGGTVTKNPDQATYDDETSVQLTANANAGYRFSHWSGALTGSTNPDNVTMNANKTVTANFVKIWPLTVNVDPVGGGTVTKNPDQATYDDGTSVQLTANANAGYRFSHWSGDLTGSTNPDNVTMNANKTVTANFQKTYELTMAVNPGGSGTTTPAVGTHTYDEGTVVNITATPAAGYGFVSWTGDVANSNSASTTVTVDGNKTVTANFDRPDIALNPTTHNYGDVEITTSASRTFVVSNTSPGNLNVTNVSLGGVNPGQFSIDAGGAPFTVVSGNTQNIDVSFNPTTSGAKTATLSIASNDPDENPFDVPLSGNGIVIPDIAVNPSNYNYGNVVLNHPEDRTFVVENEGTGLLTVGAESFGGPNADRFTVKSGGGGFPLAPGTTCNVVVTFNPTTLGDKNATLSFPSDDPDEDPFIVPLSGKGVLHPDIDVNPTMKDFGDVTLGSSLSQVFEVRNIGWADLRVSFANVVTSPEEYGIDGGGSFTLIPGATRDIEINFTPTSVGTKDGLLRIVSNDPDEHEFDILLTGNGVPPLVPDIAVTPESHDYGSAIVDSSKTQTFTVSNVGTADLTVTGESLEGTNSDQFNIDSGTVPFTLVPGATHDVEVSFNPTTEGVKTATLRFVSNDPDENPKDVALTGTGTIILEPDIAVTPESHDYGSALVDSSKTQTFTVSNLGTADLTVTGESLEGTNADQFNIDSGTVPFTLVPGATHDVEVSFNPTTEGVKTATLRFVSDDPDENPKDIALAGTGIPGVPDIAVSPESKDYGPVQIDSSKTQTFTVTNEGTGALTVTGESLEGTNADQFNIDSGTVPFTLVPGATHDVEVSFNPTTEGVKTATLRFVSDDPDENPKEVALTGTGIMGDNQPPYLTNVFPVPDAMNIPVNTDIQLKMINDGTGVDSFFDVFVNGSAIVTDGVDVTGGRVTITSHSPSFTVHYDPETDFADGSTVTVQVQCHDLATPANPLDETYTFDIGTTAITFTTEETVGPVGGTVTDLTTDVQVVIPAGAMDDSVNITIGTAEDLPPLPEEFTGIGLDYHFGPDGIQFNDSVTIRIPYTAADLTAAGVTDPMDLDIYYYSHTSGEWVRLDIFAADPVYVYVKVKEFCYLSFAIISTGIEDMIDPSVPVEFMLMQNHPNPFNPETAIRYRISEPGRVSIEIFNATGQRIRMLVDEVQTAGLHEVVWNGRNDSGEIVTSGMYFYLMKSKGYTKLLKMIFMK